MQIFCKRLVPHWDYDRLPLAPFVKIGLNKGAYLVERDQAKSITRSLGECFDFQNLCLFVFACTHVFGSSPA